MCGIVGMLTFAGGVSRWRPDIERATQLMARRGPDAAGLWTDGACCLLGFRRLAILDLSDAGNQPMITRDGRYALVFNGELYNYREIRETLQARGVTFRSTGDAEVVLYALAELGEAALESFNGMFALAFYDARERRLLLARDHAAIKPLYVLQHADGLLFASQYDQILSHPWAGSQRIDPGALGLYLNLGYIPAPYAVLTGSSAVEGGSWMSIDARGQTRRGRHFTFPCDRPPDLAGHAATRAVDDAVHSAVRRQMVSDVPVGVLLSGGIDSPLVAAAMRRTTAATLPAFTLGTNGDEHDESREAGRYAGALGLQHIVEHITPESAVALLEDVVSACSEPADDYSIFPTALISRVAREHVKVVLSGDGGDDIFWGYPARMIRPLRGGNPPEERRGLFAAVRRMLAGPPAIGPLPSAERISDVQLRASRFVDRDQLDAIFPTLPPLPEDFVLFRFEGGDVNRLAQWVRWNEYTGHLARVLQKVDRASMHYSLEVRVPLLDREVVEIATRVDWRSAVDLEHEVGKLPLRAALKRHAGFQTPGKRGFDVPMAGWLRGPLRPLVQDLLLSRNELLGLPLDRHALGDVFRRHALHVESSEWLLWRLLSLALWETRHFRSVPTHA